MATYHEQFNSKNQKEREDYFYKKREEFNTARSHVNNSRYSQDWAIRAAQFIFLNKTCFNGLYRVNSKGAFNVPCGKYKSPKIFDEKNLIAVSHVLSNVDISCADYTTSYDNINSSTFVYLDPPYRPISTSASFTSYTKSGFNDNNQRELADFIKKIHLIKGAKFILSNSDPQNTNIEDIFFDDLYQEFDIQRIRASRAINSNGSKRGKISELMILNYKYEYTLF